MQNSASTPVPVSSANTPIPAIYAPAALETQADKIANASVELRRFFRQSAKWETHECKVHDALNRHLQTCAQTVVACRDLPLSSDSVEGKSAIERANAESAARRTAIKNLYKTVAKAGFDETLGATYEECEDYRYIKAVVYLAFPATRYQSIDKEADKRAWQRAKQKHHQYTNALKAVLDADVSDDAANWIKQCGGHKKVATAYKKSRRGIGSKSSTAKTWGGYAVGTAEGFELDQQTHNIPDGQWVVTICKKNGNTLDVYEVLTDNKILKKAFIAAGLDESNVEAFLQALPQVANESNVQEVA